MQRSSTYIRSMYFGTGLLIVESGRYLSGAVGSSLVCATLVVACWCESALRCFCQLFLISVVVFQSCYLRWVSIIFVVVTMFCLIEVRRSGKGMSVSRTMRQRCWARRWVVEIVGCRLERTIWRPYPFIVESAGKEKTVWRGVLWTVQLSAEKEMHTSWHGRSLKESHQNINWGHLEVLDYIGFGQFLDAECFSGLLVKGGDLCIDTKRLIKVVRPMGSPVSFASAG